MNKPRNQKQRFVIEENTRPLARPKLLVLQPSTGNAITVGTAMTMLLNSFSLPIYDLKYLRGYIFSLATLYFSLQNLFKAM